MTALLAAVTGVVLGEVLRRWLDRRRYRLPDEHELRARRHRWLPPALGLAWALVAVSWWAVDPPFAVVALVVTAQLLALAAMDLDVRRLPDRYTAQAAAVALAGVWLAALLNGEPEAGLRATAGGLLLGAFFVLLVLVGGSGMGGGDAKLAPTLGLVLGYLGWDQLVVGALVIFLTAAAWAAGLLLFGRASRKTLFAFGPHMVAGALLVLVGTGLLPALTSP